MSSQPRHKVRIFPFPSESTNAVLFRYLATCSADHTVKIWSTAGIDYTLEKTLTGHQRWVWDAAFSADSAYLVTGKPSVCQNAIGGANKMLKPRAIMQLGYGI